MKKQVLNVFEATEYGMVVAMKKEKIEQHCKGVTHEFGKVICVIDVNVELNW